MAATKIVIVAGQEFSVPSETDNEAIRQQLASMGFADVASATVQRGKRTVAGEELETVEFVKKAGTKGLGGAELTALLASVPPADVPGDSSLERTVGAALQQLGEETLAIGDALAIGEPLIQALSHITSYGRVTTQGETLCATCDKLDAVAASAPCAW